MSAKLIEWILMNFGWAMFVVAAILIIFHRLINRTISEYEIVYRWMALFPLGINAIYAFIVHLFFSHISAASIGWSVSPFQYEVAMANLAIGLIGILSFNATYGFRLATVIAATCWLWGDGLVHIYELVKYNNLSIGNAGTWFWLDILLPLILIICIVKLRPGELIVREIKL